MARTLIARAIEQCASNALRHAGAETDGLAVLRKPVEDAGGAMEVGSEPAFPLTLSIPGDA